MRHLRVELVAGYGGLRLEHLAPGWTPPQARYRLHGANVTALDDALGPARSRGIDVPDGARMLTATPESEVIVLAGPDALTTITAGQLFRTPVAAADSATVLSSGQMLVTAPVIERRTSQEWSEARKTRHRVVLLDRHTGAGLDEAVLDVEDAAVAAIAHPHDGSVLLTAGEGQDGSHIFTVRVHDDRLNVDLVLENAVPAGFAPTGDRLLLMPHPSFDNVVSVLGWPDLRPLAALTPADLDGTQARFDFYGCILSGDRILLKTHDAGLLLCSGDLRPHGWIQLATAPGAAPEIDAIVGIAPDTFAAELWNNNSVSTTVWRIPHGVP